MKKCIEGFALSGGDLTAKLKKVIHDDNVRKITTTENATEVIAEFPSTAGVAGALLVTRPWWRLV